MLYFFVMQLYLICHVLCIVLASSQTTIIGSKERIYSVNVTLDHRVKKTFMLKHMHLPLSLELAKLFCLSNNIYNEQCPTQIIRKVIFDNQLTFSAAQIKAILKKI